MKQIFGLFALLLGVCAANAQTADTVKYAAGNDLYRGITRKLPYRQMVTPYGVEVTFAKTVHIIFPAAVRYVDFGKQPHHSGQGGRCGERNPGESHDRGLFGRNELLRYLRGRQFLLVQRQVRP